MNPYQTLPQTAFWKTAVSTRSPFAIRDLWEPKFALRPQHAVATFGSCFAQHIGKALKGRGYNWLNTEPAPRGLSQEQAAMYGYNLFSCRTGNIYTASLLRQWVEWALERRPLPQAAWERDGRWFDPFRPTIEPGGFTSEEEMRLSRAQAVRSLREVVEKAKIFVFTLGLTESWFNRKEGYEYPMCPGTAAGSFDPELHAFVNQDYPFITRVLSDAIALMRDCNPGLRFILTVSPVPLTATNSGRHVLVATMESKSILRAVAGSLASKRAVVDYFPSYEIINSPAFRGAFFEPNLRGVAEHGVRFVMDSFFQCIDAKFGTAPGAVTATAPQAAGRAPDTQRPEPVEAMAKEAAAVCDEELLAAFSGGAPA